MNVTNAAEPPRVTQSGSSAPAAVAAGRAHDDDDRREDAPRGDVIDGGARDSDRADRRSDKTLREYARQHGERRDAHGRAHE
jgi:hypothetical protein